MTTPASSHDPGRADDRERLLAQLRSTADDRLLAKATVLMDAPLPSQSLADFSRHMGAGPMPPAPPLPRREAEELLARCIQRVMWEDDWATVFAHYGVHDPDDSLPLPDVLDWYAGADEAERVLDRWDSVKCEYTTCAVRLARAQ